MAFAWKFFNEMDLKSIDELKQKTESIMDKHERLQTLNFEDLTDDEVKAMQNLIKKFDKKLEHVVGVITEFDQELGQITEGIEERLGHQNKQ